jgi:hypothetical protein
MGGKARSSDKPEKSFFYIEKDRLVARFPDVHPDAETELNFLRTLRVPDDGQAYPLPAGLGSFALRHLEDFKADFSPRWGDRGGVLMPMRVGDAMYIAFGVGYPCAIKVGAGKINVLNGRRWTERLQAGENDYIVAPPQAALDGFRTREHDVVRQFVMVPLRSGYSVEEQISGRGKHGGIQFVIHPMKASNYELLRAQNAAAGGGAGQGPGWVSDILGMAEGPEPAPLAIAVGGRMRERVVADPFGIKHWDQSARISCLVTLIDGEELPALTGVPVPLPPPFTREDYAREGVPWFEVDNTGLLALGGAGDVHRAKSIKEINDERGLASLESETAVTPGEPQLLRPVKPPRRSRHPSPMVRAYWTLYGRLMAR